MFKKLLIFFLTSIFLLSNSVFALNDTETNTNTLTTSQGGVTGWYGEQIEVKANAVSSGMYIKSVTRASGMTGTDVRVINSSGSVVGYSTNLTGDTWTFATPIELNVASTSWYVEISSNNATSSMTMMRDNSATHPIDDTYIKWYCSSTNGAPNTCTYSWNVKSMELTDEVSTESTPTINHDLETYYATETEITLNLNTTSNTNMSYVFNGANETSICNDCNTTTLNLTLVEDALNNLTLISTDSNGQVNTTATTMHNPKYNFTFTNELDSSSISPTCYVNSIETNANNLDLTVSSNPTKNILCSLTGFIDFELNNFNHTYPTVDYSYNMTPHQVTINFDATTNATWTLNGVEFIEYNNVNSINETLHNRTSGTITVRFGNDFEQIIELQNNLDTTYSINASVWDTDDSAVYVNKPISVVDGDNSYVQDAVVTIYSNDKVLHRFYSEQGAKTVIMDDAVTYLFTVTHSEYNPFNEYNYIESGNVDELRLNIGDKTQGINFLTFTTNCKSEFENNQSCRLNGVSTNDLYSFKVEEYTKINNSFVLQTTSYEYDANTLAYDLNMSNTTQLRIYNAVSNDLLHLTTFTKAEALNESYNLGLNESIYDNDEKWFFFILIVFIGVLLGTFIEKRFEGAGIITFILFIYNFAQHYFIIQLVLYLGLVMLFVQITRKTLKNESYLRFIFGGFLFYMLLGTMVTLFHYGEAMEQQELLQQDLAATLNSPYIEFDNNNANNRVIETYKSESESEVYTSEALDKFFGTAATINTGLGFMGTLTDYSFSTHTATIFGDETNEGIIEDDFLASMFYFVTAMWGIISMILLISAVMPRFKATK